MSILVKHLVDSGLEPQYFDDVLYARKEFGNKDRVAVDIFYFPFGCIIIWGASEAEETLILKELEASNAALENVEALTSDLIYFRYDENSEKTFIDEEKNEVILHDYSPFLKLSLSHALAQSVKLNILENSVSNLLAKTSHIQKELAMTGSVTLSKKEIAKQIGMLFNERYSINLHSDILDVPEFFWRRPKYEPLYLMAAAFQDIQVRHNILNHRLDILHELYGVLSNERNYLHSTRLEVIIIALITIEVIIGLSGHSFFQKFFSLFG
ncbi:MAG: RMD1 family protein [Pseudomonadota bacterium]